MPTVTQSDVERLLANVQPEPMSGCWLWLGVANNRCYGKISIGGRAGRSMLVHRVIYEAMVGPLVDGMTIDHVRARGCASTLCVNPDHLEQVTGAENTKRNTQSSKTHCKAGHDLSDAYEARRIQADGSVRVERHCRACRAAALRRLRARRSKCP